jgi:hypothetical protein
VWKNMPRDKRVLAAEAFWLDEEDGAEAQQVEAIVALARRLKFRPKSIQALPVERRARQLAGLMDVSDGIATRALIAYHFAHARPLMSAFLDAVGLAHENGLITEEPKAPEAERLRSAAEAVRQSFASEDVDLYLQTLVVLDGDTWSGLSDVLPAGS